MASVDEIAIKLGIKTGDLKAALADAGAEVRKFKQAGEAASANGGLLGNIKESTKALRDFREIFLGGAIFSAVKNFFAMAIEGAKASKDATDENARAVREFAQGLESAKGVAASFAVLVIGTFNRLGEAIGDTINIARSFITNGLSGFEKWAATAEQVEQSAAAAEAAERRLAEVRKKNGAEFLAITKELADLQKKSSEQKLSDLDVYEREFALALKLADVQRKIAEYQGDAIGLRRLQLELSQTQVQLEAASMASAKDKAAVEKKAGEELKKFYEDVDKITIDTAKRKQLSIKEETELFVLLRKNVNGLTTDERTRLEVLKLAKQEREKEVEIEILLERKVTEGLTPAEEDRLAELIKQREQIEIQIRLKSDLANVITGDVLPAEQAVTAEMEKQARAAADAAAKKDAATRDLQSRSVKQEGDVRNLSNVQLDQLIANLQTQFTHLKQQDDKYAGVGTNLQGGYKSIEQLIISGGLQQAIKERDLRSDFQRVQSFFGQERAERTFAPADFERLSQIFNPVQDKKQASDIAAIAGTLKNVFPDQYGGLR